MLNARQLEDLFQEPILTFETLHGGDTASSQKITTSSGCYFVKSTASENGQEMLEAEMLGLQSIEATKTIKVPQVLGTYSRDGISSLLLAYISSKTPNTQEFETFGRQLALLHSSSSPDYFGFQSNNFIGSLSQKNGRSVSWEEFYVTQRLLPQLELAHSLERLPFHLIPSYEKMVVRLETVVGSINPSFLHGDLWSGNYLINKDGTPFLIDPAVYYGHHLVDIAMTKLFGGFSRPFYDAYTEVIPKHPNEAAILEIYQLYYLLVHLNLFGTSYLGGVKKILERYFL